MDPTTPTTPKTRTITLTDRPPVKIAEDDWPIIAAGSADDDDSDGRGNAPNREWTRTIRVRQHADGRAIVYGVYDYDTRFQGAAGATAKRGVMVLPRSTPNDFGPRDHQTLTDIIAAIRDVGAQLGEAEAAAAIEPDQRDPVRWREAVQACIADLPAEEL